MGIIQAELWPSNPVYAEAAAWNNFWLDSYYHDTRNDIIITKNDLDEIGIGLPGKITSIAFNVLDIDNANWTMDGLFEIYITHTPRADIPEDLVTMELATMTKVFSRTGLLMVVNGWNEFTFDIPFDWDGSSNLWVTFVKDRTSYETQRRVYVKDIGNIAYRAHKSDSLYDMPFSNAPYDTGDTLVPQMKITADIGVPTTVPPEVPQIVEPTNGQTTSSNVTFRAVLNDNEDPLLGDELRLFVEISVYSNFSGNNNTFLSGYFTPGEIASVAAIIPNDTYYLRMKSIDSGGLESAWTSTQTFVVSNNPPNVPELIYPKDGAIVTSLKPEFAAKISDPDGDSVNLSIAIGLSADSPSYSASRKSGYVESGSIANVTDSESFLTNNRTYYWRAKVNDGIADSVQSEIRSFYVQVPPPIAPVRMEPANNYVQNNTSTIQLRAYSSETLDFRFQYSTDKSFTSPITFTTSTTLTEAGTGLKYGTYNFTPKAGNYYWRVQTVDSLNQTSKYSPVYAIYVNQLPTGTLPLSQVIAQTNLTDATPANLDDSVSSPDSNWATATSNTAVMNIRAGFATPPDTLQTGAGLQVFRAYVRRSNTSSTANPTVTISVYENGTSKDTGTATTVNTSTGMIVSFAWDASVLTDKTGASVEFYMSGTVGGSGGSRTTASVGAIEWNYRIVSQTQDPITLDTTPPTVPTDFSADAQTRIIELTWTEPAVTDFNYYELYRDNVLIKSYLSTPQYMDVNLEPNTSYTYKIIAVDTFGNKSAESTLEATTLSEGPVGEVGSTKFDSKWVIYQDAFSALDSKQVVYQDTSAAVDSKQLWYQDGQFFNDNHQSIYESGILLPETKQVLFQDSTYVVESKQSMYQDGTAGLDSKQIVYENAVFVTDSKQVIYEDNTRVIDSIQSLYQDTFGQVDSKQYMYQDDKSVHDQHQLFFEDTIFVIDSKQVIVEDDQVRGDIQAVIYQDTVLDFDTFIEIYQAGSIGLTRNDIKILFYQDGSGVMDSKLVLYHDNQLTADTKALFYQDMTSMADSKQSMYEDTYTRSDSKQLWYEISLANNDVRQLLFHDASFLGDSNQAMYQNGLLNYDTAFSLYKDGESPGENPDVLVRNDIRIIIYQNGSATWDSKQLMYQTGVSNADSKQLMYQHDSSNLDSRQVLYHDTMTVNDSKLSVYQDTSNQMDLKQSIYESLSFSGDTKQLRYENGLWRMDSKQILFHEFFIRSDSKFEVFGDYAERMDSKQLYYEELSTKGDITQVLYENSFGRVDSRQTIYEDYFNRMDFKQLMYNDQFIRLDSKQLMYQVHLQSFDTLFELFDNGSSQTPFDVFVSVYADESKGMDSKISFFEESVTTAELKQLFYVNGLVNGDTRFVLYSDAFVRNDARFSIYSDNYETKEMLVIMYDERNIIVGTILLKGVVALNANMQAWKTGDIVLKGSSATETVLRGIQSAEVILKGVSKT